MSIYYNIMDIKDLTNAKNSRKIEKFKIVFLGDSSVGKTSIVQKYFERGKNTCPTIGACYHAYYKEVEDRFLQLEIWDTAGLERYRSIVPIYYRDVDVCMIVYDLAEPNLASMERWMRELREKLGDKEYKIIVVGNKQDLIESKKDAPEGFTRFPIENKELTRILSDYDAYYMETSAHTGYNVGALFRRAENHILTLESRIPKLDLEWKDMAKDKCYGGSRYCYSG